MIIDGHVHLGGPFSDTKRLFRSMSKAGIDRTVLVPYMFRSGMDMHTYRAPAWLVNNTVARWVVSRAMRSTWVSQKYTEAPDNWSVAEAVTAHPDKFIGMYWVNPLLESAVYEMESVVKRGFFVGIKLHQVLHPFDLYQESVQEVLDVAESSNLPVFVHLSSRSDCREMAFIAKSRPKLTIILAHLPPYDEVLDAVTETENLFCDISPLYFGKGRLISRAVRRVGVGKLIFGTDSPCPGGQVYAVGRVLRLPLSDGEKEMILGGNLAYILRSCQKRSETLSWIGWKLSPSYVKLTRRGS